MAQELWVNIFYDQNGDWASGLSHADFDEAVVYADEGANYAFTIHYNEGNSKPSIIDLTDAIREHHAEVALERRHELSFVGVW
jgi:hypothetical protein